MLSLSSPSLHTLNKTPISLFPNKALYNHFPFNINISSLIKQHPIQVTQTNKHKFSIYSTSVAQQHNENDHQEEEYRLLTATRTMYNNIVILESETSKVLLLDDSRNVHSILHKSQKWTNSYWDEFTSLPAIIPKTGSPVAIFGLGGGTVAHQLLQFWPTLALHGWELDEILVDQARMFFGVSELELRGNNDDSDAGFLTVCVGDALSPTANVDGGYAGIIVDLFANAEVLPELEVAQTWLDMKEKLMANGRIMVNCGGARAEEAQGDQGWEVNFTIKAMCEAFGGELVNWKKMPQNESGNFMAFTGPLPDFDSWSAAVPEKLSSAVKQWRSCQ